MLVLPRELVRGEVGSRTLHVWCIRTLRAAGGGREEGGEGKGEGKMGETVREKERLFFFFFFKRAYIVCI